MRVKAESYDSIYVVTRAILIVGVGELCLKNGVVPVSEYLYVAERLGASIPLVNALLSKVEMEIKERAAP